MKIKDIIKHIGAYILLLCISANSALGQDTKEKVLIINSGSSVERYKDTQYEFSTNMPYQKVFVDMDNPVDEKRVKSIIQNEAPDLIYCIGTNAYMVSYKQAGDKPIIFSSVLNWQRLPVRNNTYGIANTVPVNLQLFMFRYFFPDIKNIGILYNKKYNKEWVKKAIKEGEDIGINIVAKSIPEPQALESSLKALIESVDAIWLIPDPGVIADEQSLVTLFKQSEEAKKPVFAYDEIFKNDAAFIIYTDAPTIGRQSASLAIDIIKRNPTKDKVLEPAGSYIMINLKKVKKYKLKLNNDALDSVTKIIE